MSINPGSSSTPLLALQPRASAAEGSAPIKDDPLSAELHTELGYDGNVQILNHYWNIHVNSAAEIKTLELYTRRYRLECQNAIRFASTGQFALRSHRDLINLHIAVLGHANETRSKIRQIIRAELKIPSTVSDDDLNSALNLCLRIWTMVNFRDIADGAIDESVSSMVHWTDDDGSLQSFLNLLFNRPMRPSRSQTGFLNFMSTRTPSTAYNLRFLADIKVKATSNLSDHLSYDPVERRVYLFHYVTFLLAAMRRCEDDKETPVYPFQQAFLKETLLTIELLFPSGSPEATAYLRELQSQQSLDTEIFEPAVAPPQHEDNFAFYRSKLAILSRELDKPDTTSIKLLWRDRRNKQQWLTLWTAVVVFLLTVFFGIISSVTSIMQTVFSYKSMRKEEKSS